MGAFLPAVWVTLTTTLTLAQATRIPLPPNVQPEGVTHAAGSLFFAGDIRSAAIYIVDVQTGLTTTAVPPAPNRTSAGLAASEGILFVAGGGSFPVQSPFGTSLSPKLFAYDIVSGRTLAACSVPGGGFVNDVTADAEFAYYTDSFRPFVYRLRRKNVGKCEVKRIRLPSPAFGPEDGVFRGNGIVMFDGGLIIANSEMRNLYFVDLRNGNRASTIFPPGTVESPDGLDLVRKKGKTLLYITQPEVELVSVWKLLIQKRRVSAKLVKRIRSKAFDVPTTVAVVGDTLVTANSRFDDFPPTDPVKPGTLFSLGVVHI